MRYDAEERLCSPSRAMYLRDDRALLHAFRAGTADALHRVYVHYAPRISGFLRGGFTFTSRGQTFRFRGVERPFDLDNATQEVFARAFAERARLSYDGLRPYGDYILAIARNHVLNELRRRQEQLATDEIDPVAGLIEPRPPERTLEEREVARLLAQFLAALDDGDRAYFTVRFNDEHNQVEAARLLGITRIRARRIEARIKRDLLAFMKSNGYLSAAPAALAGSLVAVRR